MQTKNFNFSVSNDFSEIPGLQQKSKDTYEVTEHKGRIKIRYSSVCSNRTISEEKIFNSLTFEDAKLFVTFLFENRVRKSSWLDIAEDYCMK